MIAVPALLWRAGYLNGTAAFWAAYVVTRPLGASVADWLGKPAAQTGLGFGDATVSLVALGIFVALVGWLAVTRRDVQGALPYRPATKQAVGRVRSTS